MPNVLNPQLFRLLRRKFGEVRVSNPGEPLSCVELDDGRGGVRREYVSAGEKYVVCCPGCGDTRFRLYVSYMWGVPDESGRKHYGGVKCFNDTDCWSSLEARDRFREDLESCGASFTRASVREVAPAAPREAAMPDECVRLAELPDDHPAVAYLRSRCFDPSELERRFGVCWCEDDAKYRLARRRLIIPAYDRGVLRGYQARTVETADPSDPSPPPRYWTCPGTPMRELVYNVDGASEYWTVVICEGPADVWRVGPMGVALFGCAMSQPKLERIQQAVRNGSAVILLDQDAAGQKKISDMRSRLGRKTGPKRVAVVNLDEGKDPADYGRAELHARIRAQAKQQGVPVSFDKRRP